MFAVVSKTSFSLTLKWLKRYRFGVKHDEATDADFLYMTQAQFTLEVFSLSCSWSIWKYFSLPASGDSLQTLCI